METNTNTRVLISNQNFLIRTGIKKEIQDFFQSKIEIDELLNLDQVPQMELFNYNLAFVEHLNEDNQFIIKLRSIISQYSQLRVVLVSSNYEKMDVSEVLKTGIMSCINQNVDKKEFELVMNAYKNGVKHYSTELFHFLTKSVKRNSITQKVRIEKNLSNREVEILELLSTEKTNAEIAEMLHISKRTVEGHRQNLKKKLNINTTTGLIKFALNTQSNIRV